MKSILLSAFILFVYTSSANAQSKLVKNYQTYKLPDSKQQIDTPTIDSDQRKAALAGEGVAYVNEYEHLNNGLITFGYIIWGTRAELVADGIIQKNADWSYDEVQNYGREEMERFIQIETDSLSSINIPGALQYLLTKHDKDSYKIEKGDLSEVQIIEKDKFWANGNFLVVITEE